MYGKQKYGKKIEGKVTWLPKRTSSGHFWSSMHNGSIPLKCGFVRTHILLWYHLNISIPTNIWCNVHSPFPLLH
jgi:hypothetical protein